MLLKSHKTSAQISLFSAVSFGAATASAGLPLRASESTSERAAAVPVERALGPDACDYVSALDQLMFSGSLPSPLLRQSGVSVERRHQGFEVSPKLKPRVDYWLEVLSTSRNVVFFSHRDYPWIEFARLDFSALRDSLPDEKYYPERSRVISRETEKIRAALQYLARGSAPRSAYEQGVYDSLMRLPRGREEFGAVARDSRLIWSQPGIRERMEEGLRASGRYFPLFQQIMVEKHGLPRELLALALLESALNPRAHSRMGAVGLWQIMPGTAKDYELKFSDGRRREPRAYDERRDFVLATEVAAQILSRAFNEFKSWPLAVTSYHAGAAGTARAVREAGSAEYSKVLQSLSFYSRNYFSEVLAALELIERRAEFFPALVPYAPLEFVVYPLSRSVSAKSVMAGLDVSRDVMELLNPALGPAYWEGRRPIPSDYALRLPAQVDIDLLAALERKERRSVIVKRGETLSHIARAAGVKVEDLRAANGLSGDLIHPGRRLFLE